MRAEAETGVSHAVRAKAANAEPSPTNDMTSIQTQLTSMTEILKSAKFLGKGQKRKGEATAKSADTRQGLQGPRTSAAGPFRKGRPPYNVIAVRDGATLPGIVLVKFLQRALLSGKT